MLIKKQKILIISSFLILACFLFLANLNTIKAEPSYESGTLLKSNNSSAVYYIDEDNKKYVFTDEKTYYSWYDNFDNVVQTTVDELDQYEDGGAVTIRPGNKLITHVNTNKVYAVEPNGVLRYIPSEETAINLYGTEWKTLVVDIPTTLFTTTYTKGEDLNNTLPTGTIVKQKDTNGYYYIENGKKRIFTTANAFNNNKFRFKDAIEKDISSYEDGISIQDKEDILIGYGEVKEKEKDDNNQEERDYNTPEKTAKALSQALNNQDVNLFYELLGEDFWDNKPFLKGDDLKDTKQNLDKFLNDLNNEYLNNRNLEIILDGVRDGYSYFSADRYYYTKVKVFLDGTDITINESGKNDLFLEKENNLWKINDMEIDLSNALNEERDVWDCGIAEPPTFLSDNQGELTGIDIDDNSETAWQCFTNKIESCTPAKIISTLGNESTEYNILGMENNVCKISGPSLNMQTGESEISTCDFSDELIQSSFQQSEIEYPGEDYIKGYNLMGYITRGCKDGDVFVEEECIDVTECIDGDGCCPSSNLCGGNPAWKIDNDCEVAVQEENFLSANNITIATSNNPHTVVLLQNFYYDEADNVNHGSRISRGMLEPNNEYIQYSTGLDDAILIVTVLETDGNGVHEQIVTANIDGQNVDIYLPEEDPYIITGESYYVSESGSTYYMLFKGNGTFMSPEEAFYEDNLARKSE